MGQLEFGESKSFPEDAEFLLGPMSKEKLQSLPKGDTGQGSVAEEDLLRMEARAQHDAVALLHTDIAVEEEDILEKDLRYREWFMTLFPLVRRKLEACIGELHTLADKVDKVHRDCTISNVAASSTGAVSGILTIAGLCLAPVTAGASLALLTAGMGLGVAAAVTGVSASIVDRSHSSVAKAKANRLLSTSTNEEKVIEEALRHSAPQIASLTSKCFWSVEGIVKNANAIKTVRKYPQSLSKAMETMSRSSTQGRKVFKDTALAMTKGARVAGMAMAGFGLLLDVVSIVDQSMYLHKGTKAATAEELRKQAQALERKLESLTRTYEQLQRA